MRRGLTAPERLPASYSLLLTALVLALDYAFAPSVEMPGLYLLPVIYGAWYGGKRWALPLSFVPFVRVLNIAWIGSADALYPALLAAFPRTLAFMAIGVWVSSVAESHRALKREVALLQGLLPICAHCKKIRDDGGEWQSVERYIQDRSDATFTHGVCDTCLKEHFADVDIHARRTG